MARPRTALILNHQVFYFCQNQICQDYMAEKQAKFANDEKLTR